MNIDEQLMQQAIDACRRGIEQGQTPFGACIARRGDVLACTHNHVWLTTDPTAHAEVHCIRQACREAGTIDLDDATIYSTTEPCPMCFGAIYWARIRRIVYGCSIRDAADAGFKELHISNQHLKEAGRAEIQIEPGFMREPCLELFHQWKKRGGRAY